MTAGDNPFARANGGDPTIYVARPSVSDSIEQTLNSLANGMFGVGRAIDGMRGNGKTVELERIRRRSLELGLIPVSVRLGVRQESGPDITGAMARGLASALGERLDGSRDLKVSLKASLPEVPVEIGAEGAYLRAGTSLEGRLRELVDSGRFGGVVFLVDEADFLTVETFEAALVTTLAEASDHDWPVTAILAGATLPYRRVVAGRSSFASTIVSSLWMPRLDSTASSRLLIETAESAGRTWYADELAPVVKAARGIPRALQLAGARLWDEPRRVIVDEGVSEVANWLSAETRRLSDVLPGTALQRRAVHELRQLRPARANLVDVETAIRDAVGDGEPNAPYAAICAMHTSGELEVDLANQVTYLL